MLYLYNAPLIALMAGANVKILFLECFCHDNYYAVSGNTFGHTILMDSSYCYLNENWFMAGRWTNITIFQPKFVIDHSSVFNENKTKQN